MKATIMIEDEHWELRSEDGTTLWRSRNGCSSQNQDDLLEKIYGNRVSQLSMSIAGGLTAEQISSFVLVLHGSPHGVKGTRFEGADLFIGFDD